MTTFYLDYTGGSDGADGLSFANRWKTVTSGATAARIAPGDVIRVMKSADAVVLSTTADWTSNLDTVTLTTAQTATISDCDAAWTQNTNVTASLDSGTLKQGTNSVSLSIAAGFTTGRCAHRATGTLDLSTYQQVSFWFYCSATYGATTFTLRLCSDTGGVTTVNTITIPAVTHTNTWTPIVFDNGAALGSSIQSVALYAGVDPGTVTVKIDNIFASKAASSDDSLTLNSLISKTGTSQEPWYNIMSILGTEIRLDSYQGTPSSVFYGYYGTTETTTIYKRTPTQLATVSSAAIVLEAVQDSGTDGSPITFSGGWNTTDMTTQTGETWYDGRNWLASSLEISGKNYISLDNIYYARCYYGINANSATGLSVSNCGTASCLYGILGQSSISVTIDTCCNTGGQYGSYFSFCDIMNITSLCCYSIETTAVEINSCNSMTIDTLTIGGSESIGMGFSNSNNAKIEDVTIDEVTNYAVSMYGSHYNNFYNLVITGSPSYGILCLPPGNSENRFYSGSESGATTLLDPNSGRYYFYDYTYSGAIGGLANYADTRVSFGQVGGVADTHAIYTDGGNIVSEASVRHTASGISWKMNPTNAIRTATYPLVLPIGKIAVSSGTLVTVKLWMRRTNTGLTGTLVCRGGQLAGIAADVTADMTAAIDTWEEITITFTPSESGVLELEVWAHGGTTYSLYVDDLTVTQA